MAIYVSEPLNSDERREFLKDFYELEVSRVSRVTIRPVSPLPTRPVHVEITLSIKSGSTLSQFLHATFTNGMMHHWGWDKKFRRIER